MSSKISYIFVFIMSFLGVVGTLYYLTTNYTNIFALDFTHAPDLKVINHELGEKLDSLENYYKVTHVDTLYIYNDTSLVKKNDKARVKNSRLKFEVLSQDEIIADLKIKLDKKEEIIQEQRIELEGIKRSQASQDDAEYKAWIKSTVKMFEKMDSKKAAKIIESYSDNVAREIIYAMKNKIAAEILSRLNPETVTKLTGK